MQNPWESFWPPTKEYGDVPGMGPTSPRSVGAAVAGRPLKCRHPSPPPAQGAALTFSQAEVRAFLQGVQEGTSTTFCSQRVVPVLRGACQADGAYPERIHLVMHRIYRQLRKSGVVDGNATT